MKKYTKKRLTAIGIIILLCNMVCVSCDTSRFFEYYNDDDLYDEYFYDYDDDLMDVDRY